MVKCTLRPLEEESGSASLYHPVLHALCPVLHALCPVLHALCRVLCALCSVPCALCNDQQCSPIMVGADQDLSGAGFCQAVGIPKLVRYQAQA